MLAIHLPEEKPAWRGWPSVPGAATFYAREAIVQHLDDLETCIWLSEWSSGSLLARDRRLGWMMWRPGLVWRIEVSQTAEKQLAKLDRVVARRSVAFLRDRASVMDDPRAVGEALKGSELGEFWMYRIGDWRLICQIEDAHITVRVVRLGNRREIYR